MQADFAAKVAEGEVIYLADLSHGRVSQADPEVAAISIGDGLARLATAEEIESYRDHQLKEANRLRIKEEALIPKTIMHQPSRRNA